MALNNPEFAVAPVRCYKANKEIDEATGFFYYLNGLYFITCRHVVIEEEKDYYPDEIRLLLHKQDNKVQNKMFSIPLYSSDDEQLWLEHPQYGKEVDVVAIPIEKEDFSSQFYIKCFFHQNNIPSHIDLSGEEVIVIGYPLGFRDTIHNFPIFRNATIASVYPISFEGKPRFLIDSRLHRGTSGSPVITKAMNTIRTTSGDIIRKLPPPRFFLGVHSETVETLDRDPNKDEPLGLNFVWFAYLIPEIIQAGHINQRYESNRKLKECNALIIRDSSDLVAWGEKGNAHSLLGEYDDALQAYDKVLELDPSDAKAWNNKGLVFVRLCNDKKAIQAYDKAIELDKNLEQAWSNKGNVLANQDEHQKALECFTKAAELNPLDATNWNNKGSALYKLNRYDEAIDCYDEAIKIDPSYAKAWYNKGNALDKLGNITEAKNAFAKANDLF